MKSPGGAMQSGLSQLYVDPLPHENLILTCIYVDYMHIC